LLVDSGGWELPPDVVGLDAGDDAQIPVDGRGDWSPNDTQFPDNLEPDDALYFDLDIAWPDLPDQEGADVPEDLSPGWCSTPGGFGCECSANDDCNSGWCVETPGGFLCSMTCIEECPEGWICTLMQDPPDAIGVCMPAHPTLCNPCSKSQECQGSLVGLQVLCVDRGADGSFCGGDCSNDGLPCPDGYLCEAALAVDGTTGTQCVPESGECACSPLASQLGLSTACYVESEWGQCPGERTCEEEGLTDCSAATPQMETCNGEDDDCDGVADDNLAEEECQVVNEYGACTGSVLCVGGDPVCQGKEPSAELCDGLDNNCDGQTDEEYSDCDQDSIADCIEVDDDADGYPDEQDNCQCAQNPSQTDTDYDGVGDACDADDDNDSVPDTEDCAPLNGQVYPGAEEACNGKDDDCDDLVDEGSLDSDQDGEADCVDMDDDGDGLFDNLDNCPTLPNEDQLDSDFDSQGDVCDPDDDNDGHADANDCGPTDKQVHPGAPEMCDCKDNNCDGKADEGFTDTDGDGVADCCEDDTDGDGVPNGMDNCMYDANPNQENADGDINGDACDPDDDNDGVTDLLDCAPLEPKAYPNAPEICDAVDNDCDGIVDNGYPDLDEDGLADCMDPDDDGDGVADTIDLCPFTADALQLDTDLDGVGDACDGDDDGDGEYDITDCEPLNPAVHSDADEVCNGKDDDCDGTVDGENSVGCITVFPDVDADGFGEEGGEKCLCGMEPPYVSFFGGDCDDDDELVNPLVKEICNGKDDDCDGSADPGCAPESATAVQLFVGGTQNGPIYDLSFGAGPAALSNTLEGDDFDMQVGILPATNL